MDEHETAVAKIAAHVRQFYERKEPYRIYHGSTNSTRQTRVQRDKMIDTSNLSRVLKIDLERMTALVEPNVPMDSLIEATIQQGLIPPVVMEFPGITVGGGFAGTSGESSSYKYGFFDRTINWIEIILPDGVKATASRTENPDLFYGAASSFGTLGVTTLLEIQLIKAKTFVELTYHPISSMSQAMQKIDEAIKDLSNEYVDGIMYTADQGVICTGRLTDKIGDGVSVQRFTRATDPWFYLHAKKVTASKSDIPNIPVIEAVPIVDYLFRYDRGGFWVAVYAFKYFITPFNRVTRWALDRFMHTRVMYHALHKSGFSSQYIIQDVAIPFSRSTEFIQYLDQSFRHYPLWLCPLKYNGLCTDPAQNLLCSKTIRQMPDLMLNFGVWGPGPKRRPDFVAWNRDFEDKVQAFGGQKWLYAHAYYTEEEFNQIYDRKAYDALREKYHATYLPSVYEKVKVDIEAEEAARQKSWISSLFWSIWPLSGLYGVYHAMRGGDYLLPQNRTLDRQQISSQMTISMESSKGKKVRARNAYFST